MTPEIGQDLDAAYRSTRYDVIVGRGRHGVRVGAGGADLAPVFDLLGASRGVFITAWNPRSVRLPRARNDSANRLLAAALTGRVLRFLPHEGVGDGWAERGYFVAGLDDATGLDLAARFGQLAVVAVARGGVARLLYTGLTTGG